MPDSSASPGRRRELVHLFRSVRVRITVAAVLVTAVAVGTAGGLLVRSVEDSQIRHVRQDIDNDLDRVAAGLEDGMPLEDIGSVQASSSLAFLQVTDGRSMIATFAAGPQGTFLSTIEPGDADVLVPEWPPLAGGVGGETRAVDEARSQTCRRDEARGETCVTGEPSGEVPDTSAAPDGERRTGTTPFPSPGEAEGAGPIDPSSPLDEVEQRRGELLLGSYETISRTVDTDAGELTLTAAVPVDQLAGTVDTLRRGLTVGLPALIAVVAALAWVLVGRALRPVEAIRTEVDAITGSTMHRRVPVPPTGDEIGRLARTMNAMLGRLDAAATRQRQFVSDASHELRSPVTALRTCLEVAGRHPDRADWPAVVGTALAEESRLEALLDDLLLLAAHDEDPGTAPEASPVDVAAIVEAEAARPRRVPVEVRLPAGPRTGPPGEAGAAPVVPGDADRLARALANLVDNAARYATDAVRVTVARHDDALRVTVDDDGPGIPAGDRERVFERFTRLDDGRARPEGGTGLGLAVVRSIVEQHHGRVWAEESPLHGARLVVELPVLVGQGATGPARR